MLQSSGRRVDLAVRRRRARGWSRLHVVIPTSRQHWFVSNIRKIRRQGRPAPMTSCGSGHCPARRVAFSKPLWSRGSMSWSRAAPGRQTALPQLPLGLDSTRERIVCGGLRVEDPVLRWRRRCELSQPVSRQFPPPPWSGSLRMRQPDHRRKVRQAESSTCSSRSIRGCPAWRPSTPTAPARRSSRCVRSPARGANVGSRFVVPTVASSIDIVVHAALRRDGVRRVQENPQRFRACRGRCRQDSRSVRPSGRPARPSRRLPPHLDRFGTRYDIANLLRPAA